MTLFLCKNHKTCHLIRNMISYNYENNLEREPGNHEWISQSDHAKTHPVFRRSTRKVPAFYLPTLFVYFPEPRFFPYLQHIFNALLGLFLLIYFFRYVIIIVLYSTLFGGLLWHTI